MRLVVAEDSLLLREGLVRLLKEAAFDVVGQAADAEDLVRKVAAHRPDVAIIDIQMPPTNTDDGLRAALHVRATQPDVGVLVLSQFVEEAYALDLIGDDAASVGYLLKDPSPMPSSTAASWPAPAPEPTIRIVPLAIGCEPTAAPLDTRTSERRTSVLRLSDNRLRE